MRRFIENKFPISGGMKSKPITDDVTSILKNDLTPKNKISNHQAAHID
ncbi:MAG: hypothetical protein IT281_10275 [Ignavibacteria bacterium]|nr:hypothetical protein [Ignavibacteria bacterium]